jgi:4-hydroxy-tetrahydrodipicolinate reductase
MVRVGVIGAQGRMGSETCRAVDADDDLELVARIGRGDALETLTDAGAEVAIEFTTPASVRANVLWCADHGLHTVVGATGLGGDDIAEIERAAKAHGVNVFIAPNFAIGAVLMMRFAALAAPYFDAAEVIEMHHAGKADAPSGTALATARRLAAAKPDGFAYNTPQKVSLEEARGGESGGVGVHAVRLPGLVADQEVLFGLPGQTLTITHRTTSREAFGPGVLLALRRVTAERTFFHGLDGLLGLTG